MPDRFVDENLHKRGGMYPTQQTHAKFSVMADADHGQATREPFAEGNLKLLEIIDCGCEPMCVRFSPDGNLIAAGLKDGCVRLYGTDTGQCMYSLTDPDTNKRHLSVTSVKFCPADPADPKIEHHHILMATYASGFIKFWHYPSQSCLTTIHDKRQVDEALVIDDHERKDDRQTLASAISVPLMRFATTGADPVINIYDLPTKKLISTCGPSDARDVMNGHRARVFAIQYHPTDPHLFVSGGWDDTVQIWDDRKKHSIRKMFGPHVCGDALDIDSNHNHLLTGSWRKSEVLQIWDFATGEKIKDVPQDHMHGSLLYCAQWLGREYIICGGCEQNMARIIDRGTLNTVGQLVDLPAGVFSIDHEKTSSIGRHPRIVIAAGKKIYVVRIDKRQ